MERIIVENRTEFMRLISKIIGESMPRLPLEREEVVVNLLMVAFDTGHELALTEKAEVYL